MLAAVLVLAALVCLFVGLFRQTRPRAAVLRGHSGCVAVRRAAGEVAWQGAPQAADKRIKQVAQCECSSTTAATRTARRRKPPEREDAAGAAMHDGAGERQRCVAMMRAAMQKPGMAPGAGRGKAPEQGASRQGRFWKSWQPFR